MTVMIMSYPIIILPLDFKYLESLQSIHGFMLDPYKSVLIELNKLSPDHFRNEKEKKAGLIISIR